MRVARRVQNWLIARALMRNVPAQPVYARRKTGSKLVYRSRVDAQ